MRVECIQRERLLFFFLKVRFTGRFQENLLDSIARLGLFSNRQDSDRIIYQTSIKLCFYF